MNTKLHAATDQNEFPNNFFITARQISDCTGATALLESFLAVQRMLVDQGHDADRISPLRCQPKMEGGHQLYLDMIRLDFRYSYNRRSYNNGVETSHRPRSATARLLPHHQGF
ncbi:hypothetical protein JK194_01970 [Gluconobacter cerinus]|nr:hypothetical protein [Gluconobacter cerinus]